MSNDNNERIEALESEIAELRYEIRKLDKSSLTEDCYIHWELGDFRVALRELLYALKDQPKVDVSKVQVPESTIRGGLYQNSRLFRTFLEYHLKRSLGRSEE